MVRDLFDVFLRKPLAAAMLAAALLFCVPVSPAYADSLREVAERVARQHDAKVISAREVERNGRKFYEIRILTRDGVVKTVRVPARD
ncbi:MAG: PepSY domain-containing protein [Wenzhouxiangellaceae bacterium]